MVVLKINIPNIFSAKIEILIFFDLSNFLRENKNFKHTKKFQETCFLK